VGSSYVPVPCIVLACGTAKGLGADVPRKCCSSLISRRARLARIFLLKTLVTFLMATPSPVWLLVAALEALYQRGVCVVPRMGSYQTMPYAPCPSSLVTL
jgi:hypothetical protein